MRIAFIVGIFPLLSETFILNQITGLIERGHEIDIYALRGLNTQSKRHPSVEQYRLLDRTYYVPERSEHYFRSKAQDFQALLYTFSKAPLICLRSLNFFKYGKKAIALKILHAAILILDKKPYDIIHCQFGGSFALEGLILREIGAIQGKLVTSFRGWDISRYVQQSGDRVYNQLFEAGDIFLPVCNSFRRQLIQLGCDPKKIIVHRSGIDCSKFAFTPRFPRPDGRLQLVTTGRLVEKKGIEYGIRAVAKLSKIYPNLEYNVIGDGELKEYFEQLIQELGVSHLVKLLGYNHQQEVIKILNNSQIFIAPSVIAQDGNQEGIPNSLKEAMAMGLPVIATKHSGIPELVEDGVSGFLVPERDADAIADKLKYLIEHSEIWTEIGKIGRWRIEAYYDKQRLNNKLVEIYQKVLNEELNVNSFPMRTPQLKTNVLVDNLLKK